MHTTIPATVLGAAENFVAQSGASGAFFLLLARGTVTRDTLNVVLL